LEFSTLSVASAIDCSLIEQTSCQAYLQRRVRDADFNCPQQFPHFYYACDNWDHYAAALIVDQISLKMELACEIS
jgi:hypothetical protein